ncbi:uncharacterized protein LOC102808112 [Saccoglossus kowalevskii]
MGKAFLLSLLLLILIITLCNGLSTCRRRRFPNSDWGGWASWSSCSKTCGAEGTMQRFRDKNVSPRICDRDVETVGCNRFCNHGGTIIDNECYCPGLYGSNCCNTGTLLSCYDELEVCSILVLRHMRPVSLINHLMFCPAIDNCEDVQCTTTQNQYCLKCEYDRGKGRRAYEPVEVNGIMNRICEKRCSWRPDSKFCYPGNCTGNPSTTCECANGFTGDNCQESTGSTHTGQYNCFAANSAIDVPTEKEISISASSGQKITVWMKAYDVMGNEQEDKAYIYVDETPPDAEFKMIDSNGNDMSMDGTTMDFDNNQIMMQVSDEESGIYKITWELRDAETGTIIYAEGEITENKPSDGNCPTSECECLDIADICYYSAYVINTESATMIEMPDGDVECVMKIIVYNNAMIETPMEMTLMARAPSARVGGSGGGSAGAIAGGVIVVIIIILIIVAVIILWRKNMLPKFFNRGPPVTRASDWAKPSIIMEFAQYDNLSQVLRRSRQSNPDRPDDVYGNLFEGSDTLTSQKLLLFSEQVASGMEHVSSLGIIHRKLGARNVFVGNNEICKIGSFSKAIQTDKLEVKDKQETRLPIRWMAPESLSNHIFSFKTDVWSFGILLWEIVTLGALPYPGMKNKEITEQVAKGYRMEKPPHCTQELFTVMLRSWNKNIERRPGFGELVQEIRYINRQEEVCQLSQYDSELYGDINDM